MQSWLLPGVPLGARKVAVITEVRERIDAFGADQVDVRALAAVAAVRPAERHELLATKAHRAAPAVAGLNLNSCFVDESHDWASSIKKAPDGPGLFMPWRWLEPYSVTTLTNVCCSTPFLPILHTARGLRKQRVVRAGADVVAGAIDRAALTHEDVAGQHLLAAELLEAESLRLGFAAVLGTAACLFVCHDALSLVTVRRLQPTMLVTFTSV